MTLKTSLKCSNCHRMISKPTGQDLMNPDTALCAVCKVKKNQEWREKKRYLW